MNAIEPSQIHDVLRRSDLFYSVDRDGDFIVRFEHREDLGTSLVLFIELAGDPTHILTLHVVSDRRFPSERLHDLLVFANEWACSHRWPHPEVRSGGNEVSVVLADTLRGRAGVSTAQIGDFIVAVHIGAQQFWRDFRANEQLTSSVIEETVANCEALLAEQDTDST